MSAFGEIHLGAVKLFDIKGKWMVLTEISIELIFLLKRKESNVPLWLFKYILWSQWFAYELLPQVYERRHVFFLSIYHSILILFSVNYR